MAGENCDLNKDEAEILKPSSSPPPFLKPSTQEFTAPERPERPEKLKLVDESAVEAPPVVAAAPGAARGSNRCSSCRKKVGLTGFRCRCGELFCGRHRYSDAHECSFDYKAAGREQISKNNPLVRAAKIIKI